MQFVYAKVFEWLVYRVNRTLLLKEVRTLLLKALLVHKYKNRRRIWAGPGGRRGSRRRSGLRARVVASVQNRPFGRCGGEKRARTRLQALHLLALLVQSTCCTSTIYLLY